MRESNFRNAIGNRWIIGRAVCQACKSVRAFVAEVDVEQLECPQCGGPCERAQGPEAVEHKEKS